MIKYFLKADTLTIDLGQIHKALFENRDFVEKSLIMELRDNIEDYVFQNEVIPEVKFNKDNWEYHKSKQEEYQRNLKDLNGFKNQFFLKNVIVDENLFNKKELKIRADEHSFLLYNKERKNTANNLPKKAIKRQIAEFHWWDYSFDIYHFDQKIVIENNYNDEFFGFFFSFFFVLLDPSKMSSVFSQDSLIDLKLPFNNYPDYIALLAFKYPHVFETIDWKEKLRLINLNNVDFSVNAPLNSEDENDTFKIKKPVNRRNGDRYTVLTEDETFYLFYKLREAKILLDHSMMSKANFSRCISGLTGFSDDKLKRKDSNKKLSKKSIFKIQEILRKLNL